MPPGFDFRILVTSRENQELPGKSKADTILAAQTTVNTLRFGEWISDA